MLAVGVMFWEIVLAVHIVAVVAAFGVIFAYPLMLVSAERIDPRGLPTLHRVRRATGRWLINPGLTVVLIAGIYLASDLHQWNVFYVQWAIAVVVVLGGLEGAYVIRQEGKLAELAERDLMTSGTGEAQWSAEYLSLRNRARLIGTLMTALIVITVYLMTVQA